jgi:ABC-type multidrug transport system fused ATPase/permease subunit
MVGSTARLLRYVGPDRTWLGLILLLRLVLDACGLVHPLLARALLDDVLPSGGRYGLLFTLACIGVGVVLASAVLSFVHSYLSHKLGQRIIYRLRNGLYRHLQSLSVSFFESQRTGEIMSRVVNDSEAVEQMLVHSVEGFITSIYNLVLVSVILFILDARLAVVALVPVPLLAVVIAHYSRKLKTLFGDFRQRVADLNAFVQDRVSGIRVVKTFTSEDREQGQFEQMTGAYLSAFMKAVFGFSTFGSLRGLLTGLGAVAVLGCGGWLSLRTGRPSPGTVTAVLLYLGRFYVPLEQLGRLIGHSLPWSVAAADRIFEFLDTEDQLPTPAGALVPSRVEGAIEVRGLTFGYKDETVLDDIDLAIEPRETVALVGPSGVGKTTLVDLVCRFYDPRQGHVLIDGVDVRQYDPRALREHIGVVLQEPFLFNTTVEENISYGRPGATEQDIVDAATRAGAHEFISELPEGYRTPVGERGVKLSVGQKQRISIARALLKEPAILILDEATSSVDTITERAIQDALAVAARGRTTILIAHRLSTTDIADRVVVLEKGRIVEQGTQAELLGREGRFAELYRMQSAGLAIA